MIWFDLDNSPHVPLFRPIFAVLKSRSAPFLVTGRDFAQTKSLLEFWKIESRIIGHHGGKSKVKKILNLFDRSMELARFAKGKQLSLAVSHGSRTQLVAAKRLGIRSVLMLDYEYTERRIFNTLATVLLMPALIPEQRLIAAGFNMRKVVRYDGFKEELYLNDFVPEPSFRAKLGIGQEKILVTIRPPAVSGNYHNEKSEGLYLKCLEYFSSDENVHCLVVARTSSETLPSVVQGKGNISLLSQAVDGLQLIWNSDIVVSGGGTMNRESALLGVPTYSIFTGRKPYLDEYLRENKKLHFVDSINDVENIPIVKRSIPHTYQGRNSHLPSTITDLLLDFEKKATE